MGRSSAVTRSSMNFSGPINPLPHSLAERACSVNELHSDYAFRHRQPPWPETIRWSTWTVTANGRSDDMVTNSQPAVTTIPDGHSASTPSAKGSAGVITTRASGRILFSKNQLRVSGDTISDKNKCLVISTSLRTKNRRAPRGNSSVSCFCGWPVGRSRLRRLGRCFRSGRLTPNQPGTP